jgi:outer membrane receptor for ferrienterochelin and colicin
MRRALTLAILLLTLPVIMCGQGEQPRYWVKGKIVNARTHKTMRHIPIKVLPFNRTIETNRKGEFSFNLPEGEFTMEIDYPPFEKQVKTMRASKDTSIIIELKSSFESQYLDEVEVISHKSATETAGGIHQITSQNIRYLPAMIGERDILKAFSIMSGVSSSAEGTSQIQVRGGNHAQNLFLLDGVPLYSTQHMLGMVSAYNSTIIHSASLYKSGFPAEYGGKLSGIIDVTSKDANTSKLNGEAELGLLSSKANINFPIIKDKLALCVAGRISNYAILNAINIFTPKDGMKLELDFADINSNITWDITDKDKLRLSFFYNRDGINTQSNNNGLVNRFWDTNQQKNIACHWNRKTTNSNNRLMLFVDSYQYKNGISMVQSNENDNANRYQTATSISSVCMTDKLTYKQSEKLEINAGFDLKNYWMSPINMTINSQSKKQLNSKITESVGQANIYTETKYRPLDKHLITMGARLATLYAGKTAFWELEPRLNYHYNPITDFAINASLSKMTQPIHQISNSGLGYPMSIFVPSDIDLKPQTSWNYSLGCAKDVLNENFKLSFTLDLWYKTFQNITEFKDGYDIGYSMLTTYNTQNQSLKDIITQGKGEAYGVDFSTVLDNHWLKLTLDYTWMKATNQFMELNQGKAFDAPTDMRHTLTTTAEVKLSKTWIFSAMWQYHTGKPITIPTAVYENPAYTPTGYEPKYIQEITTRNNYRFREFHRLDIAFSHKYKAFKKYDGLFSVGIYNVYNRANPYLYYIDTQNINGTPTPVLKSMSIFPILPSVSWSVRF